MPADMAHMEMSSEQEYTILPVVMALALRKCKRGHVLNWLLTRSAHVQTVGASLFCKAAPFQSCCFHDTRIATEKRQLENNHAEGLST